VQELKAKRISDYSIKKALAKEIDPEDYKNTLIDILNKKAKLLSEQNPFKRKQKLAQYAMSRGFESELIWNYLQEKEEEEKEKKSKK
jgi:regulatory protein